jgi:hypothetical protein
MKAERHRFFYVFWCCHINVIFLFRHARRLSSKHMTVIQRQHAAFRLTSRLRISPPVQIGRPQIMLNKKSTLLAKINKEKFLWCATRAPDSSRGV